MQKSDRRLCGNQGLTLIELVVVVLIMGIVAATAFVGISQTTRMDADGTAGKIQSSLELTRMQTIAAANDAEVKLKLAKDSNGYYASLLQKSGASFIELDRIDIGPARMTVQVKNGAATSTVDATGVIFTYRKSDGSFTSAYDTIVVSGVKTKNIVLVKATGRCYIE